MIDALAFANYSRDREIRRVRDFANFKQTWIFVDTAVKGSEVI